MLLVAGPWPVFFIGGGPYKFVEQFSAKIDKTFVNFKIFLKVLKCFKVNF